MDKPLLASLTGDNSSIKCFSICQPKAWMLFESRNIVETKNYFINHRGLILIHAGNLANNRQLNLAIKQMDAYQVILPELSTLPTQAIIGSAELVECFWSDQAVNWSEAHTYHWHFERACLWENPIPFVSKNALFNIPLHIVNSYGINLKNLG